MKPQSWRSPPSTRAATAMSSIDGASLNVLRQAPCISDSANCRGRCKASKAPPVLASEVGVVAGTQSRKMRPNVGDARYRRGDHETLINAAKHLLDDDVAPRGASWRIPSTFGAPQHLPASFAESVFGERISRRLPDSPSARTAKPQTLELANVATRRARCSPRPPLLLGSNRRSPSRQSTTSDSPTGWAARERLCR